METGTLKPVYSQNGSTVTIAKDIAEKEVNDWLTRIDFSEGQRKDFEANINIMVNAVQNGTVSIDPKTNDVTQKLKRPFGKEEKITQLKFKTDISVSEINQYKKGIDHDSDNRNTIAYICASTGNLASIIEQMNARDFNVSTAIVLFFVT